MPYGTDRHTGNHCLIEQHLRACSCSVRTSCAVLCDRQVQIAAMQVSNASRARLIGAPGLSNVEARSDRPVLPGAGHERRQDDHHICARTPHKSSLRSVYVILVVLPGFDKSYTPSLYYTDGARDGHGSDPRRVRVAAGNPGLPILTCRAGR
jgi:hypothetical protein